MKKKAWLLFLVVPVAVVAYLWIRPAAPIPVSGGPRPKPAVDTDALMAQIKAQSQPAATVPAPGGSAPAATEPVPDEQEELRAIDAYATTERQKVETWYSEQMADLKAQLEQRVQTLSDKDKLAWAQFFQRAKETWSAPGGRSETPTTSGVGDPAAEYASILALTKDSRQATQEDFLKAQIGLAWMRQDKLAAVQREVDRRKAMLALQKPRTPTEPARKQTADATPKVEPKQTADPTPKVEAITAGAGNRFRALIGDTLVSEGTVVQGYRVQKIYADRVEFEKDGKTSVQKVN
jgi:hypothetical protein